MSDGRKRIRSPFTWCKKRKAWNKTKEKYMLIKIRQNLAETDRGSYYKEEQLRQQTRILQWQCGSDNDDES